MINGVKEMEMEKNMLKFSAIGGLFFAVLGLAWGLIIESNMLMFDGLYALVSMISSIISILITTYIAKSDFDKFPFGKGMLEPITVAVKSLVLIVMCGWSFITGVQDIILGGSDVDTSLALGYSIVSSVLCIVIFLIMQKKSKRIASDILKSESNQWFMDSIVSMGVLIGFILSFVLAKTDLAYLTRYIDSFMVIISSLIFIRVPAKGFIDSFNEMINGSADIEINNRIYTIVKGIEQEYNFESSITRVSKVGRELRIEIDFVFNDNSTLSGLKEMDKVREKVYKNINNIELKKWLNVNFTGDRKWAV
jgi:predicted Co/Zn/Cd cation transporter (cation efflux family)